MKPRIATAALAALVPLLGARTSLAAQPRFGPAVVYGEDDRQDLYQVKSDKIKKMAGSTVALIQSAKVTTENGVAKLQTSSYAEEYNLCPEEPFSSQRTAAFCSGSLVGPDLVMTAGHCVRSEESCKATKFVFGFGMSKEGQNPESVPEGEVYDCASIVGREENGGGADFAVVKLNRAVGNHAPLQVNRSGKIENGTKLLVIGHPSGLPTKVAGGASVRDTSKEGFFVANLDTYGGNSGSAVFNAETGMIEGILVRGEQDYTSNGQCRVSNRCPADGCRGEDVTRISSVASLIPPLGPRADSAVAAAFAQPAAAMTSLNALAAATRGASFDSAR